MKINQDIVPSTIQQAVDILFNGLEQDEKDAIINNSTIIGSAHFGIGRWIRNNWHMWENNCPLKNNAIELYKLAHADDISGLILSWLFAKVKGENFDPNKHCEIYHEHWKNMGIDSISAGKL